MARDFALLYQSIWSDPDWRQLDGEQQRVYTQLLSWKELNYAGVTPTQPRKWATCTRGATPDGVVATIDQLDAARFLVVDWDTEECLVRSFIRRDGLWRNPPMLRVALRLALQVESQRLRAALADELRRIRGEVSDELGEDVDEAIDALAPPVAEGAAHPVADLPTDGVSHPVAHPVADPVPHPVAQGVEHPVEDGAGHGVGDGVAHPPGVGAGVGAGAVDTHLLTEQGYLTSVDAGARDPEPDVQPAGVPDTRPAPHDDLPQQAPPAAVHENAMPPARCPVHLELAHTPPCGRCADARKAQDAWKADREARIARARAEAEAEHRQQRADARRAIDLCEQCDERGVTPHGVTCTHVTATDPTLPPGRAAFLAERAKLSGRRSGRVPTAGSDPITGQQLVKLAICLGEAGHNERDERLAYLSERVGREITTSRELTKAEGQRLIDELETSLPPEPDDPGPEPVPADEAPADPTAAAPADPEPQLSDSQHADLIATWADEPSDYAYAGGPDDEPPF